MLFYAEHKAFLVGANYISVPSGPFFFSKPSARSSLIFRARNFQFSVWHWKEKAAQTQRVTRRWCKSKQDIISKDWWRALAKKSRATPLCCKVRWNENIDGGGGWGWKRADEKDKGHSSFAAGGTRKRFYLRRWFIASIYLSWYTRRAVRVAVVRYTAPVCVCYTNSVERQARRRRIYKRGGKNWKSRTSTSAGPPNFRSRPLIEYISTLSEVCLGEGLWLAIFAGVAPPPVEISGIITFAPV